ncbi:D-sedoheptulose-7-phosphate isomerase [Dictyobacter arantiisoli]|uniref:Phosphoheptose isomerase n=1 Tax=Dictyobacter arantiisoli TaxID=2014874 RepID=A0A5A5T9C3_9CHLR|nr:SIS domain-containing protein [Dictyobacter arantiisoli]GCF07514.1 phosphoheptose isomerase [Dictyobacter arantiisoli]
MYDDIRQYWHELACSIDEMPVYLLNQAAEILLACYQRGNTIFLLGNGGSAATASHFACDLTKGTQIAGIPAIRAIALTDNVALMTAWANDTTYERIFSEQLAALVRPDDVVILISTSGQSPNILAAAHQARRTAVPIIALTGPHGGQLAALADLTIRVPGPSIEQVEDEHMIIAHSLCVALRKHLRAQNAFLTRVTLLQNSDGIPLSDGMPL